MLNLDKKKKYLLGCSFGPDSMALLSMLLREGYDFSAGLVNYNLRKESVNERDNFIEYCKKNNIVYFVKDVDMSKEKGNTEENARLIRYQWFSEICLKEKFDAVLIAQHQGDLIETYLLQKKRNNKVMHFGISEDSILFGVNVIRPLLNYSKKDLLNYCNENNVPYAIDSSNLTDQYERNKIRHSIVENLSSEERKELLEEIRKNNEEIKRIFAKLSTLDLNDVNTYGKLSQTEVLYALNLLVKNFEPSAAISKKFADEIIKAIFSKKPSFAMKFKENIYLIKEYDRIYFSLKSDSESYSYLVQIPSVIDTPYFHLDFTKNSSNRNVKESDYPLTIRNADKKDKITIKDYQVEARRLFIDWKMPKSLRSRWPVILNKDGKIIYIPRYQKDFVIEKDTNFFVK